MESVRVEEVKNRSSLNKFIRFNYELYRGNRYAVPELYRDMVNSFNVDSNAALEFCDMVLFIAYRGDKVAGRIAGIINRKANAVWNKKSARFGWIDFVDDPEVSKALIYAVEKWGRSFGMTEIEGPLGFTDFDPEGMLTEGFDQLGTMSTIYNYRSEERRVGKEC